VAAAQPEEAGGLVDGDDLAVGQQLRQAPAGDHQDQRRDDGLQAQAGDEQAVPQPAQQRRAERRSQCDGQAVRADQHAGDRAGDGDDGAHRHVDAARGDDQRHAERREHQRCGAVQDVDEAAVEVAVLDLEVQEAGHAQGRDGEQQRQRGEWPGQGMTPEGGGRGRRRHGKRGRRTHGLGNCSVVALPR
jgi:hypothetical protein